METNQAAENLQVIRTLMERSALYRRALAPIMLFAGVAGVSTAVIGTRIQTVVGFVSLWSGAALITVVAALLLARRQALKDAEAFWSPPTRRIAQAMLPALFAGLAATVCLVVGFMWHADFEFEGWKPRLETAVWLPATWSILYGCALHAAGFFTPNGVRILGWAFILCGLGVFALIAHSAGMMLPSPQFLNYFMGIVFGGLHLAAGIYLYFTEKRKNVA